MSKHKFWKSFFSRRMLIVLVHGFCQGLPAVLIGSTLKLWMANENVALSTITFFTWVSIPYSWKFLWSPFLDRYRLTGLGRRRSWMLLTQILMAALLLALSGLDPNSYLFEIAVICTLIGFLSATQDIAIDAYRREFLPESELGLGSSMVQYGYRIAMLVAGGLAVYLVDPSTMGLTWPTIYIALAILMGLCALFTLAIPEPEASLNSTVRTLRQAVIEPFHEFLKRDGAVYILLFVFLFKFGDAMAGSTLNPFYAAMGYANHQIGLIAKTYGLFSSLIGLFLGGASIFYLGIYRCLWIFGILQALSTASFVLVIKFAPAVWPLAVAVLFEDFTAGMGSAAFLAFISAVCSVNYTATQYALLSSIATSGRNFFSGWSGKIVEQVGWEIFFYGCAVLALPGLFMLVGMRKFYKPEDTQKS